MAVNGHGIENIQKLGLVNFHEDVSTRNQSP